MDLSNRFKRVPFPLDIIVLLALTFGATRAVHGQAPIPETRQFQTQTPTDQEFLTGSRDPKAVTISGELRIPHSGVDRVPAMVILHGSGGVTEREQTWARELNGLGMATFVVNSFVGRGLSNTAADQEQLSRLAMVVDAYRALEYLAGHPRVDPSKIMLMGFSRGGGAAHWAAVRRFAAMHGPVGGLQFAGFIAFYPTCNRDFIDGFDVVSRPVRFFHGTADDYNPVTSCRAYVDRLRKAGSDVELIEYAGAHHAFDNAARKSPVRAARAQTTRNCPRLEETSDGQIVNSETKKAFTYASDPCVERGTTLAYNEAAHSQVLIAVKEFVTKTLFAR